MKTPPVSQAKSNLVAKRVSEQSSQQVPMNNPKNSTAKVWRLLLFPMFFNMLVCAYSGNVGWMLFWTIAFSGGVHEYGYECGKTEHRPRLFL
jgi:hypothetical protein